MILPAKPRRRLESDQPVTPLTGTVHAINHHKEVASLIGASAQQPDSVKTAHNRGPRVAAIDVVRGALLVISVITSSLIAPPEWFEHAPWAGVHPLDVVFPAFVVLTGAGLGFAHKNGVRHLRLVRRVATLALAGLAYNALMVWAQEGTVNLSTLRWTGVLQMYAAIVLVIALLHIVARGWIIWAGVSLVLGAVHTIILAFWASRCAGGALTPQCNPSLGIDAALLPTSHLYRQFASGHDPEGLVALLGACATAAAGTAAAHAFMASRPNGSPSFGRHLPSPGQLNKCPGFVRLFALAGIFAAGATVTSLAAPAMKRLWSAPFGLLVASVVVLIIALVSIVVDSAWATEDSRSTRAPACVGLVVRAGRRPFIALGRNSLLVYFGSHVLIAGLLLRPLRRDPTVEPSYAQYLAEGLGWLGGPQVGLSAVLLIFWWWLAIALHRRGWYLRA